MQTHQIPRTKSGRERRGIPETKDLKGSKDSAADARSIRTWRGGMKAAQPSLIAAMRAQLIEQG
jgi:hypothetical protein